MIRELEKAMGISINDLGWKIGAKNVEELIYFIDNLTMESYQEGFANGAEEQAISYSVHMDNLCEALDRTEMPWQEGYLCGKEAALPYSLEDLELYNKGV